jgi:hypothetical protein
MNICEFIQEKVAIGEFDDNVSAHLRICHECKAFADDLERFLSCDLPDAGEPPKHVDDAIRAAAADAAAANRFLSCDLPDAGEPPKHVDDAIRAAGHRAAAVFARGKRAAWSFRILIPAAAMLAVCFLSVFVLMTGRREAPAPVTTAAVPETATPAVEETVATVETTEPVLENVLAEVPVEVGDWTGAAMDGELTQVTMVVFNSMDTLSLSDTDLLLAQLEADFAAYAEN